MKSLPNSFQNSLTPKLILLAILLTAAQATAAPPQEVTLDGETIRVYWNDGDSFRVNSRSHKGMKVRIVGFNTLENHGPVHRWGRWTKRQLLHIAYQGKEVASQHKWACFRVRVKGEVQRDHYGRTLIECPDLAEVLISAGLAHLFAFDPEDLNQRHLGLQLQAQREGVGMWALGVPDAIVTSVHSHDEKREEGKSAYNRVANVRTGLMGKLDHKETYGECEDVCLQGSCLMYVPFAKRYGKNRAECLKTKKKE